MAANSELLQWAKDAEKAFQEAAAKAKVNTGGAFEQEGTFICKPASLTVGKSKNGDMQVTAKFVILEGEFKGRTITKWYGMDDAERFEWFCSDIKRMGLDPTEINLRKFEAYLKSIPNEVPAIEVRVVEKNGYYNAFVNKPISDYDGDGDEDSDEGAEDEEEETDEVEEEEEEEEEESRAVGVGMVVQFVWKGDTLEGEIVEIDEENEKVKVKVGTKKYPVSLEKIVLVEDDEEEDEDEELDEEDEEEDEPEPEPVKRGRGRPRKS